MGVNNKKKNARLQEASVEKEKIETIFFEEEDSRQLTKEACLSKAFQKHLKSSHV